MKNMPLGKVLLVVWTSLVLNIAAQAATITVNSLSDTQTNDGSCSLREAIINANADNQTGSTDCTAGAGTDTINITTAGDIILLTELPNLTTSMTVNGLGAANTTVRRDAAALTEFRIFTKTGGTSVISNLTARDGIVRGASAATGGNINGGGISNTVGQLTLTNVTVTNNQSIGGSGTSGTGGQGNGGGINTAAALVLTDSTVSNNTATGSTGSTSGGSGRGGGLYFDSGGTLTATGSVISGNTARGGTGTNNGNAAADCGIAVVCRQHSDHQHQPNHQQCGGGYRQSGILWRRRRHQRQQHRSYNKHQQQRNQRQQYDRHQW